MGCKNLYSYLKFNLIILAYISFINNVSIEGGRYHIQVLPQKQESRQIQARIQNSSQAGEAETPGKLTRREEENERQAAGLGEGQDRSWAWRGKS